ncbi:hypothetical protein KGF56_004134 [Candida oxycetoniae]|uniref:Uncharacterized protein n=1 Tax=Candida oxycetoniae TaxID=497107 RepID=A0AAI9SV48_9ASCO|nr:uncharacterized protein KGF56_004134 [Candida oxycetoniae]KAI3403074.2 hypothetical protein KGF56_004134 [Candida oxycetoniae]
MPEPLVDHNLLNKELREQAIAEALAREEAAIQKAKEIRELVDKSKELITTLNKTPTSLINERILRLNKDLAKLPQTKVKQLDEELREFIVTHMKLSEDLAANRPWTQQRSILGEARASNKGKKTSQDESEAMAAPPVSSQYISQYPNLKPTPDYKGYSDQELYLRQLNYLRSSGKLGSKVENVYKPQRDTHKPMSVSNATVATLLAAGCHMGHATASFRASFQPFLYGVYNGIHLIDLNQTIEQLRLACKVIEGVSEKGGVILYVGTHKNWSIQESLVAASNRSKGYYVSKRWIPGTITNYIEVTKQIKDPKMKQHVDMENTPVESGRNFFNSIIKPDLVVLLNPVDNRNCIKECISACIPTIALCDTDMEASLITYPIPCNDDNVRSVNLMLGILSKAAETGLNKRLDAIQRLKEEDKRNQEAQLQINGPSENLDSAMV